MSIADKIFKSMCNDILENGVDTKGELVRPHWPDGELAYTTKKFGVVNRYDLRKEFPALTLRKTAIKSATDEILWIYQKKSNNIKDLNSSIWDEWSDKSGSIGKAYGYQIGKRYIHHNSSSTALSDPDYTEYPSREFSMESYTSLEDPSKNYYREVILFDQIDSVLWDLRHNPYSRRIMTNMYNFEDLHEMSLYPCAYSMTFNCTKDSSSDKLVLNAILNQRSQDVLAANNWNVCQYAILLMMIAQSCNMIAGELVHVIADCHIYDRHIPIIRELISREEYEAPKVWLTPDITDFYKFTTNDVHIENYKYGPQIKDIPIAI